MKKNSVKRLMIFGLAFLATLLAAYIVSKYVKVKGRGEMVTPAIPTDEIRVTPELSLTPVPEYVFSDDMGEEIDFRKNLLSFSASNFTINGQGTYKICYEAHYYNYDGSYAGSLYAGDRVYANASNSYYKNIFTYVKKENELYAFTPECGKYVYRVVIDERHYYMNPEDLYGSFMGTGIESTADRDETEAFCVADSSDEFFHGEIIYFDSDGNKKAEEVYDVCLDGVYYFVSMVNRSKLLDNYMTYHIPWGKMWTRLPEDPPSFTETDTETGYEYRWETDTFCFMDLDMDGLCEYEVKVAEWFRWKALE